MCVCACLGLLKPIWANLELLGSIWANLGLLRPIWPNLELLGPIWPGICSVAAAYLLQQSVWSLLDDPCTPNKISKSTENTAYAHVRARKE